MPRFKKLPLYKVEWYGARLNIQEVWLVEKNEVKGMNGLRMMVSQGTHMGIVTVGRNRHLLRVTSTLLFIAFSLVLGFLALGQGFKPFSPLLGVFAPL